MPDCPPSHHHSIWWSSMRKESPRYVWRGEAVRERVDIEHEGHWWLQLWRKTDGKP
ncbi:hypothetical protein PVK06_002902 [Gossypium arboreum]|uniref:Uncharacterized protein n=1 Tax=Gossypium arboreum TaxID=29729 RepID=A0ABR0R691_GOSAR|nr:hypothetical protein PVK06_002902 [Gossypium arboreum]